MQWWQSVLVAPPSEAWTSRHFLWPVRNYHFAPPPSHEPIVVTESESTFSRPKITFSQLSVWNTSVPKLMRYARLAHLILHCIICCQIHTYYEADVHVDMRAFSCSHLDNVQCAALGNPRTPWCFWHIQIYLQNIFAEGQIVFEIFSKQTLSSSNVLLTLKLHITEIFIAWKRAPN